MERIMQGSDSQTLLHTGITYLTFKTPQAFSHPTPIKFDFLGVRSGIVIFQT